MLLPVVLLIHGPRSKIWKRVATEPPTTEVTSRGLECPPVGENRTMGDHIKDQIILFSAFGEVLAGVINDMICAQRAQKVQLAGVIHPGHFSPVQFGQLHGK